MKLQAPSAGVVTDCPATDTTAPSSRAPEPLAQFSSPPVQMTPRRVPVPAATGLISMEPQVCAPSTTLRLTDAVLKPAMVTVAV